MSDAPAEGTDVLYQSIDGEIGTPEIAQIRFTLDGVEYYYRAKACENIMNLQDISGLYYDYDVDETVQSVSTGIYIEYAIQYCTPSGIGHTTWFDPDSKCQYDLSAQTTAENLKSVTELVAAKDIYSDSIQGIVTAIGKDEITLSMENGNIVKIPCRIDTDAKAGDKVNLWYSGTIGNDDAMVLYIEVIEAAGTYSGEVVKKDDTSITIAKENEAYTFILGDTVEITGAQKVKVGDIISVVYTGQMGEKATVIKIEVEFSAPEEPEVDPELIDKTLKGTVTKVHSKNISIVTSKGKKYTFIRTKNTVYSGNFPLQVGCTVCVRYDGYASKKPDAKEIEVLSAPAPTPTDDPKPKTHTVTGTVESLCGIWIVLSDGHTYTVNSANCNIQDEQYRDIGASIQITYYMDGDERIAVKAKFLPPPTNPVEPDVIEN